MNKAFIIQEGNNRRRLDHFLTEQGLPYSRSRIQKWILEGLVLVNEMPVKGGYRLKSGDRVLLSPEETVPLNLSPEARPLSIYYEDGDLLVLDKPPGLVVHPAPGHTSGTLVHALLFHCRDLSGIGGVLRPGIVHRLDKDTSGLLVVAKNDLSHQALVRQFQAGKVRKEYLALVWGGPPTGRGLIDRPIGRHPLQRKKMAVNERQGKPAITEWLVLERFPKDRTLLKLNLKTGRTHQIRVHLSSLGFPVMGDPLYGGRKKTVLHEEDDLARELKKSSRQLLHAACLGFRHPRSGEAMDFSSPLPGDMDRIIGLLRDAKPN